MIVVDDGRDATGLEAVSTAGLAAWRESQSASAREWLTASGFEAAPNQAVRLPGADGAPGKIVAGIGARATLASFGQLATTLPEGDYRLLGADGDAAYALALGWGLGGYRFADYNPPSASPHVCSWRRASNPSVMSWQPSGCAGTSSIRRHRTCCPTISRARRASSRSATTPRSK